MGQPVAIDPDLGRAVETGQDDIVGHAIGGHGAKDPRSRVGEEAGDGKASDGKACDGTGAHEAGGRQLVAFN